jgi:hypothetical protein
MRYPLDHSWLIIMPLPTCLYRPRSLYRRHQICIPHDGAALRGEFSEPSSSRSRARLVTSIYLYTKTLNTLQYRMRYLYL